MTGAWRSFRRWAAGLQCRWIDDHQWWPHYQEIHYGMYGARWGKHPIAVCIRCGEVDAYAYQGKHFTVTVGK